MIRRVTQRTHISAMSGNEIFCLSQKGLSPGEIVVGNSVYSMGVAGSLGAAGRTFAGGEITQVTSLISEGRHAAIQRMEEEAKRDGAVGVTGVQSRLGRLAGFTEFLAQGTGVHLMQPGNSQFFSTAASGIGLYCQLDARLSPKALCNGECCVRPRYRPRHCWSVSHIGSWRSARVLVDVQRDPAHRTAATARRSLAVWRQCRRRHKDSNAALRARHSGVVDDGYRVFSLRLVTRARWS